MICTCKPVHGWRGKLAGYALDPECARHGDVNRRALAQPAPVKRRARNWTNTSRSPRGMGRALFPESRARAHIPRSMDRVYVHVGRALRVVRIRARPVRPSGCAVRLSRGARGSAVVIGTERARRRIMKTEPMRTVTEPMPAAQAPSQVAHKRIHLPIAPDPRPCPRPRNVQMFRALPEVRR